MLLKTFGHPVYIVYLLKSHKDRKDVKVTYANFVT